jgi:hypothetical protein
MSSPVKPLKPHKLRKWRLGATSTPLWFFTCARAGRTGDPVSKTSPVSDVLVHRWVLGLLELGPRIAIVSLLGQKPDGTSEVSFYSFFCGFDPPCERRDCLSFQQWLDRQYSESSVEVREHPTCDFTATPLETLDAISKDIRTLVSVGRTVVMDSGGETRTGEVCRHTSAVEDSSSRRVQDCLTANVRRETGGEK